VAKGAERLKTYRVLPTLAIIGNFYWKTNSPLLRRIIAKLFNK